MKYKIFARRLDTGETVLKPENNETYSFTEAKKLGRQFVLEKQEETGTGWTWHIEESKDN